MARYSGLVMLNGLRPFAGPSERYVMESAEITRKREISDSLLVALSVRLVE